MTAGNIQEVLKRHTDELMTISGVVGVAEGKSHGRPCIRVFVVSKNSELLRRIPETIEGFSLQIEESGQFHALDTK